MQRIAARGTSLNTSARSRANPSLSVKAATPYAHQKLYGRPSCWVVTRLHGSGTVGSSLYPTLIAWQRFADQPNPLPAPPSPTPAEPHVLAAVAASPDGSAVAIAHRTGFRVYTCRPARGEAHLL
jgi:hypothetical protein